MGSVHIREFIRMTLLAKRSMAGPGMVNFVREKEVSISQRDNFIPYLQSLTLSLSNKFGQSVCCHTWAHIWLPRLCDVGRPCIPFLRNAYEAQHLKQFGSQTLFLLDSMSSPSHLKLIQAITISFWWFGLYTYLGYSCPDHTKLSGRFQLRNCWGLCSKIEVGPPLFTLLQPEMLIDGVISDWCDQPLRVEDVLKCLH